ncbi:hypothetical protein ACHQM5_017400 [Ranunculus cassubicifolius]
MIVRTYGRRNRSLSTTCSEASYNETTTIQDNNNNDDDDDNDNDIVLRDSVSQDSISKDIYNFTFSSSQDSTPWTTTQFDSDSQPIIPTSYPKPPLPNSKKLKNSSRITKNGGGGKVGRSNSLPIMATSTLMEAQEFGEMMEHVDEVNFALDGLRKCQPARIRRASLLSLLSICETPAQRRMLRAQGMAKTILDAILSLSLDDSPSTLAAATLFFVLASDGEDEQLLDSPSCIKFLLKLLNPIVPVASEEKRQTLGFKLLALRRDPDIPSDKSKRLDASSTAIISKVQDILLSCEEIKSSNSIGEEIKRPELTAKWVALLTLEKACLSTVSIEDTSATVRKVGGNFKETLRELGGLDAVFDVAAGCHSVMKKWSDDKYPRVGDLKDDEALQTVVELLKCLKIMENATFLSKDNQDHVLGMSGKSGNMGSTLSFTSLVISVIKILSGLSLRLNSSVSSNEKSHNNSNCMGCGSESPIEEDHEVEPSGSLSRNSSRSMSQRLSSNFESSKASRKRQKVATPPTVYIVSSSDTLNSVMKEEKPSTSSSCNGSIQNGRIPRNKPLFNIGGTRGRRSTVTETKCISLEESQDPFAFDEDEFAPSKWERLSTIPKKRGTIREVGDDSKLRLSVGESSNSKTCHSCEVTPSCSPSSVEVEDPILLGDCLLAAVKVLMNLTNDNPVGCKQIAGCGGLEILSALISGHYPSYLSPSSSQTDSESIECSIQYDENETHQQHFSDQEIDFLVAILGLLVNLVEKDSRNRSRLAATTVSMSNSSSQGSARTGGSRRDVIPLLCSIFLANQGAGETAEEEKRVLPWDDEDAVTQGEREAEKMIIEAYAALLLAFLSTESKSVRERIARCLPNHSLEVLVPVLERFVAFHLTLNMISPETHSAVTQVIESCKGR